LYLLEAVAKEAGDTLNRALVFNSFAAEAMVNSGEPNSALT